MIIKCTEIKLTTKDNALARESRTRGVYFATGEILPESQLVSSHGHPTDYNWKTIVNNIQNEVVCHTVAKRTPLDIAFDKDKCTEKQ